MPIKPTRVRYAGVGAFVNDVQANRVQAFGSSSRLSTEDIKELGTLNIVEIVDDVPQVDVSIDQNENGTADLVSLLSNKGYGCQVVAIPVGAAIGSASVKVLPGVFTTTSGHPMLFTGGTIAVAAAAGQNVYLNPTPTGGTAAQLGITGGAIPAGSIALAVVSGSALIKQADITEARPTSMQNVTHYDFELANVDIFVPVKQSVTGVSATGNTIARTMYMEKVYVNNIDLNFQVNGLATTSYRLETDNKRWFLNAGAQMVVDQFKSAGGATLALSQTPNTLNNGNKLLKLIKNGSPLVEGTDFTVAGTTITFTPVLAANDLVKTRYTASTGGNSFLPTPVAETPHPELAGGLKEGMVEIFLSDNTGTRLTRVQTAKISLPLTREQLGELGSLRPYDRPLQLPVNANVTLEFKDSDLEMFARFAGKDINTVTELALDDLLKNMSLIVRIFRESDVIRAKLPAGHPNKFVIKSYTLNNIIPQNENWDVRVDSDATQTFEFLAHNILISDKIVPNL